MPERRDAVADVLGDESPMTFEIGDLARQATTKPKNAAEKGGAVAVAEPPKRATNKKPRRNRTKKTTAEPLARAKRMKVSIEEEQTIDDLVSKLGREVGTKVQFSHVARAMWSLLLDAEGGMSKVKAPKLHRPENGNLEGLAEFEADLAEYLLEVFQVAPRPRR